jgi:hypothetical protein
MLDLQSLQVGVTMRRKRRLKVEDEDDRVRKLPLRDSYNDPPIVLYVSSAPKSKLTKLARQNIVADAAYFFFKKLI